MSAEVFDVLLGSVGRLQQAQLLRRLWKTGALQLDAIRLAGTVWSMTEYPENDLDLERWRAIFDDAGYTVDGRAAVRPADPCRLFRGATHRFKAGWSWTSDLAVARQYANDKFSGQRPGHVWVVDAPPDRLLCHNSERDESEFVLEVRGLPVTGLPRAAQSTLAPRGVEAITEPGAAMSSSGA